MYDMSVEDMSQRLRPCIVCARHTHKSFGLLCVTLLRDAQLHCDSRGTYASSFVRHQIDKRTSHCRLQPGLSCRRGIWYTYVLGGHGIDLLVDQLQRA